jgi:hypothetical protein
MDALTDMYRSAYFNSLKQNVIEKAKAIIKTNSEIEQEYAELVVACIEFRHALGNEEVNADDWACAMASFVDKYGIKVSAMSESLQALCDTDPSEFIHP